MLALGPPQRGGKGLRRACWWWGEGVEGRALSLDDPPRRRCTCTPPFALNEATSRKPSDPLVGRSPLSPLRPSGPAPRLTRPCRRAVYRRAPSSLLLTRPLSPPHTQTLPAGKGEARANPLQVPEAERSPYQKVELATKKVVPGEEGTAWHVSTEGGSKEKKAT